MYRPRRRSKGRITSFLLFLLALVIALIPTELFFLVRHFLSPHGFWQELILGVVGLWFLGSLQFIFLVIFLFFCISFFID
ncbi:MAG: hypothetical protein AAB920_02980 [Patescibacteria group bacterium]